MPRKLTPAQKQHRQMNHWYNTPHYVYVLCDPDTLAVRYVGCTYQPEARYRQHCGASSITSPLRDWVRSLRVAGKVPLMMIVEKCNGPLSGADTEKAVIAGYRRLLGTMLLNNGKRGQVKQRPAIVGLCEVIA